jgi:transposase InsO family protein
VARCLLKKIIPQFKIPVSIGSDNGLAFVAEVVQFKGLGITWKLHMPYHPQSSGKVECMNRTLKLQMGKLPGDSTTMGSVTAHSLAQD